MRDTQPHSRFRLAALAVVALSAVACGSAQGAIYRGTAEQTWRVDPALVAEYGEAFPDITEAWCTASDGTFCPDLVEAEPDESADIVLATVLGDDGWHAQYDPNTGLIAVRPGRPLECMVHILGHEIGHSLPVEFNAQTCPGAEPAPEMGPDRVRDPFHCAGTFMGGVNFESCMQAVDHQTIAAFWATPR